MKCPVCENENSPGLISCKHCGSDLYTVLLEQVSTTPLERNRNRIFQATQVQQRLKPLVVYIRDEVEPLAIQRSGKLLVGRQDDEVGNQLNIDLDPFNADELGVSRIHVELDTAVHPPTITDLDSYNGTYINGQKLMPHQSYPLQSSDEVRLGRMALRVYYDI